MVIETDYEVLTTLGEGSFGKVYRARHRRSQQEVAIKQIKVGCESWDSACQAKELTVLRRVRHNFVVRLRELLRSPKDGALYYVFEYIDSDLSKLIMQHERGVDESKVVLLFRQLLVALAHLHQQGFFHRDVKPENILFKTDDQTIRLADFGEARSLRARPPFTEYVGTRWYRAPECLLRDTAYSSVVDIWAAGLVSAELLRGSPLFPGTSSLDQLYKIFGLLGPAEDWSGLMRLAEVVRFKPPRKKGSGLQSALPSGTSRNVNAVVSATLTLNPRNRPSARTCLGCQLFASLPESNHGLHIEGIPAPGHTESVDAEHGILSSKSSNETGVCTEDGKRQPDNRCEGNKCSDACIDVPGGIRSNNLDLDSLLSQSPGLNRLVTPDMPADIQKLDALCQEAMPSVNNEIRTELSGDKQFDLDAEIEAVLAALGEVEEDALPHMEVDSQPEVFPTVQLNDAFRAKCISPNAKSETDSAPLAASVQETAPAQSSQFRCFPCMPRLSCCKRRRGNLCSRSSPVVEKANFSSVFE